MAVNPKDFFLSVISMEEAWAEKEEPDSFGCKSEHGLCVEPKQDGKLGNCSISYFGKHHNCSEAEIKRGYVHARLSSTNPAGVNEPPIWACPELDSGRPVCWVVAELAEVWCESLTLSEL